MINIKPPHGTLLAMHRNDREFMHIFVPHESSWKPLCHENNDMATQPIEKTSDKLCKECKAMMQDYPKKKLNSD